MLRSRGGAIPYRVAPRKDKQIYINAGMVYHNLCRTSRAQPFPKQRDSMLKADVPVKWEGKPMLSEKERLKVGLVGLGKIAVAQIMPACFHVEEIDLVAVCRRKESELHLLSGAVGTLNLSSLASWDYAWHESVELITEQGHVLVAKNGRELYHFNPEAPESATFSGQTVSVHWRESDGFVAEIRAFAQAILRGEPAPLKFELGLQALRISEAVESSMQEGHPVPVERDIEKGRERE